eukprot:9629125-Lingulodinium_polyedra.AAC.1
MANQWSANGCSPMAMQFPANGNTHDHAMICQWPYRHGRAMARASGHSMGTDGRSSRGPSM